LVDTSIAKFSSKAIVATASEASANTMPGANAIIHEASQLAIRAKKTVLATATWYIDWNKNKN
jgi:hypothetical protein